MDEMTANQASDKDPAEGSRENVNLEHGGERLAPAELDDHIADNPLEHGSGQLSEPEKPLPERPGQQGQRPDRADAGGITNRPLSREQKEEPKLPRRGDSNPGR